MEIVIEIVAADVDGKFTKADETHIIKSSEWGSKSADEIAQGLGKKMWSDIYREKADIIYYVVK